MKKILISAVLGILIVIALGSTWRRTRDQAPILAEGLYVKCTQADCSHFYVIPWEASRTYPRGPAGEGFTCPKCNRFAGQIATQCEQCREWILASEAARGCPRCSPADDAATREPARPTR